MRLGVTLCRHEDEMSISTELTVRPFARITRVVILLIALFAVVWTRAQAPAEAPAVLVGAGDIGDCGTEGAHLTGHLLDNIAGTVFTLGDNAYPDGAAKNFADCYEPFWGRHKARTRPSPGNHEYESRAAADYFAYFGDRAGDPALGYYRFDLGGWSIYSLNSSVPAGTSSPQYRWLVDALARDTGTCTLAYWHHPVRSSGMHGDIANMRAIWNLLTTRHADVVLAGHDHLYERFAPMNASFGSDPQGVRQFVVGTGGAPLYNFEATKPRSEVQVRSWGVLKLTLSPADYAWQFITATGVADAGQGTCH